MSGTDNNNEDFKQTVIDTLVNHGWTDVSPTTNNNPFYVGVKEYQTAVGVKTAFATFAPFFDCKGRLSGEYKSVGRNVLSCIAFNSDPVMTLEEVARGAKAFALEADIAISKSYAVKLLRAS